MTTDLNTAPDTLLSAMVYVWWQRNAGELTTPQANRLLDHMRAMCRRGEVWPIEVLPKVRRDD